MQKKSFILIALLCAFSVDVLAANNNGRHTMASSIMEAPRYTASVNQLQGSVVTNVAVSDSKKDAVTEEKIVVDNREKEKNACINNNIGLGNTFVWASRYSDTSNYAMMNEDLENPSNNVCFVRVEVKSDDQKISVSDVTPKYFMWGENITCGNWFSEDTMRQRILDAKKGARIGGIIGSTVGGVGLGVGAMELFGNKLIGGKVEGQKSLTGTDLLRSQLLAIKKDGGDISAYREALITLQQICSSDDLSEEIRRDYCEKYEYNNLLKGL